MTFQFCTVIKNKKTPSDNKGKTISFLSQNMKLRHNNISEKFPMIWSVKNTPFVPKTMFVSGKKGGLCV